MFVFHVPVPPLRRAQNGFPTIRTRVRWDRAETPFPAGIVQAFGCAQIPLPETAFYCVIHFVILYVDIRKKMTEKLRVLHRIR